MTKLFPDKQLTFSAPYELRCALSKEAQNRRVSVSEAIRLLLVEALTRPPKRAPDPPLNEALDRREAAGVARFLKAAPDA